MMQNIEKKKKNTDIDAAGKVQKLAIIRFFAVVWLPF